MCLQFKYIILQKLTKCKEFGYLEFSKTNFVNKIYIIKVYV